MRRLKSLDIDDLCIALKTKPNNLMNYKKIITINFFINIKLFLSSAEMKIIYCRVLNLFIDYYLLKPHSYDFFLHINYYYRYIR